MIVSTTETQEWWTMLSIVVCWST